MKEVTTMYTIIYRLFDLPEVNLTFKSEKALYEYIKIYTDCPGTVCHYYHDGKEYTPWWAA